jgi:hypothetical protein
MDLGRGEGMRRIDWIDWVDLDFYIDLYIININTKIIFSFYITRLYVIDYILYILDKATTTTTTTATPTTTH